MAPNDMQCVHETVQSTEEPRHHGDKFRCIVLEVFAGSARLSKACRALGLEAVAVDQTSSRSEHFPIFQIDVTTTDGARNLDLSLRLRGTPFFMRILRPPVEQRLEPGDVRFQDMTHAVVPNRYGQQNSPMVYLR